LIISLNFGDDLYYRGRLDVALAHVQKIVEADPDFAAAYPTLMQVYVHKSVFGEALKALDSYSQLIKDENEADGWRAYIFAAQGRADEARNLLSRVEHVWQAFPFGMAMIYFVLGDNDKGFQWLEKGYEKFDPNLYSMGMEPELDGVRSDPRYLSLMRRLGLAS
jgi:adenylate cyclase